MRVSDAPIALAASMNSRSRSERTSPRTMRASTPHAEEAEHERDRQPGRPGGDVAEDGGDERELGDHQQDVDEAHQERCRCGRRGSRPPRPMTAPMAVPMAATTNATFSDCWVPRMTCPNTSCPALVVPKGWARLGGHARWHAALDGVVVGPQQRADEGVEGDHARRPRG